MLRELQTLKFYWIEIIGRQWVEKTVEKGKRPYYAGPWISHFKESSLDCLEDRETLKAFNLRNNKAKLVFKSTISGAVWIINCRFKVEET